MVYSILSDNVVLTLHNVECKHECKYSYQNTLSENLRIGPGKIMIF